MSLLLLFCTISSNAKRARENITVLMICCALHKNTCKYILNALNIFFFKNCHPPSSYLDMFLYEFEKRLCFFLAAQWIFSSNLFMRSSKLSCRRLLKCDRCSSTDQSEAWPFFGGQLWWSNGSLLSLSYSYFVIKEGVKYFFFLFLHLQRCLSLYSRWIFFLCSCFTLEDTFKSTDCAVLADLGMVFLLVGKSTEFELAPPNSARIDPYFGCSC